jgi:hypothetical protein
MKSRTLLYDSRHFIFNKFPVLLSIGISSHLEMNNLTGPSGVNCSRQRNNPIRQLELIALFLGCHPGLDPGSRLWDIT